MAKYNSSVTFDCLKENVSSNVTPTEMFCQLCTRGTTPHNYIIILTETSMLPYIHTYIQRVFYVKIYIHYQQAICAISCI